MKSKTTTIILCILLGGLGVHQLYINNIAKGILYLFFCWTFITVIIAIYDLYVFTTMSDDDFNRFYNKQYR